MNQENEKNLENEETRKSATEQENTEEIENLPIESIGSYGRIEEIMTDKDSEEGTNSTAQS